MNILTRIRAAGQAFIDSLRGRRVVAAATQPMAAPNYPPLNPTASQSTDNSPGDADPQAMDAIHGIFPNTQSDRHLYHIQPFPRHGTVSPHAEHYLFTDQGLVRVEERTASILAGNEVAPPSAIGGICVCGQPIRADRVRFCAYCGLSLGPCCGSAQPIPAGLVAFPVSVLILCPTHLKAFRDAWPHWQAAGPDNKPVFLPAAMSMAVLDNTPKAAP